MLDSKPKDGGKANVSFPCVIWEIHDKQLRMVYTK